MDRSGAYMARYMAKNIVAAGLAEPVSFGLDTFGTEHVAKEKIRAAVLQAVDLRPRAIIQKFGLTQPVFSYVSCYGHFGSNAANMPWKQTDLPLSV